MDCRLVYFFVTDKPFSALLKERARFLAKKQLRSVAHSMELERQGLTAAQISWGINKDLYSATTVRQHYIAALKRADQREYSSRMLFARS
jgi:collagenase-like PrtC family protease